MVASALRKWAAQQKHAFKAGFQQEEDVIPEPKTVTGAIISLLILLICRCEDVLRANIFPGMMVIVRVSVAFQEGNLL